MIVKSYQSNIEISVVDCCYGDHLIVIIFSLIHLWQWTECDY